MGLALILPGKYLGKDTQVSRTLCPSDQETWVFQWRSPACQNAHLESLEYDLVGSGLRRTVTRRGGESLFHLVRTREMAHWESVPAVQE